MDAEIKKLVVDKVNELRKKNAETQIANLASQIVSQLDYAKNTSNQAVLAAKQNIESYRKQIEALNGTAVQTLTAEEIFGKEGK